MAYGLDPDIRLHGGVQFGILMHFLSIVTVEGRLSGALTNTASVSDQ